MLPRYLIKSTVRMVFHVRARLSVLNICRTCPWSYHFPYHIKVCSINDKYSFELPHKHIPDVHPSTKIVVCHIFGHRTEALQPKLIERLMLAAQKKLLHVSGLKKGRRQSAAFIFYDCVMHLDHLCRQMTDDVRLSRNWLIFTVRCLLSVSAFSQSFQETSREPFKTSIKD